MNKIEIIKNWLKPYLEEDKVRNEHAKGFFHCAMLLNDLIDTISEEPSENLDEAAEEYALDVKAKPYGNLVKDAFKDGAEWQKQQDNNFERFKDYTDKALISLEEAREQGRQEMKEQMLKEAVEGTVHNFSSNKPHPTVLVDAKGFNQGDKVHVIIVKEG